MSRHGMTEVFYVIMSKDGTLANAHKTRSPKLYLRRGQAKSLASKSEDVIPVKLVEVYEDE